MSWDYERVNQPDWDARLKDGWEPVGPVHSGNHLDRECWQWMRREVSS